VSLLTAHNRTSSVNDAAHSPKARGVVVGQRLVRNSRTKYDFGGKRGVPGIKSGDY
jgi:hypothetical protein